MYGHLNCFHVLAIVNEATMNMRVQVFFPNVFFLFPLTIFPEVGLDWIGWCFYFFIFWGACILFSIMAAPIYISTSTAEGFPFSTPPPASVVAHLFLDSHSNRFCVAKFYLTVLKSMIMNILQILTLSKKVLSHDWVICQVNIISIISKNLFRHS